MLAAIFNEPGNIEITDYPLRGIDANELIIKVSCCGVCGTDHHIYNGKAPANTPVILGHEYSGEIIEIESNVSGFSIGDKVVINPNIHCNSCQFCKAGKINLCTNLKALGVTHNGGFAEYSIVPISQAYKIPKDFNLSSAAFAEPLSCCIHGIDKVKILAGESVAVIGGGAIGLLMIQLAKLSGASNLIMIEPIANKRELSKKLGADMAVNPEDDDVVENIFDVSSGGLDVVIECAGNIKAVELGIKLAKKGGRILIFGLSPKDSFLKINLQQIFNNEYTILSSLLNPYTFQRAIDLLVTNKISVDDFQISTLGIEQINELFNTDKNSRITKYHIIN